MSLRPSMERLQQQVLLMLLLLLLTELLLHLELLLLELYQTHLLQLLALQHVLGQEGLQFLHPRAGSCSSCCGIGQAGKRVTPNSAG